MSHHNYIDAESRVEQIDIDYQKKYFLKERECDKKSINLIKEKLGKDKKKLKVFDLGSGNGNFLYHLRNKYPFLDLYGYEYSIKMLKESLKSDHLSGIKFSKIDIIKEKIPVKSDVGFSTAVTYQFSYDEFSSAMRNIYNSLNKNGIYIGYELFTPFNHDLTIIEKTDFYKDGIPLNVRSFSTVDKLLRNIGFNEIDFRPFCIEIDLKRESKIAKSEIDKYLSDLRTFTIKDENQNRLMFRGSIFEPWCHIICKK